ncbi:ribosomal protein L7/L12 [Streptosporangium vulgare]|uniref:ribosomal protein L7/L12 n=1 Tax=Streptosporangium vulgare TaxID=46190 RepID=UPI0031E42DB7
MPNIGPVELLIVAVLLAVVLVVVVGAVVAAGKRGRAVSGGRVPAMPLTPQGLHETVTGLTRERQKIHAIKELRRYTGLGLKEAKAVVDAVAAGHDMWSHPPHVRLPPRPPRGPAERRCHRPRPGHSRARAQGRRPLRAGDPPGTR